MEPRHPSIYLPIRSVRPYIILHYTLHYTTASVSAAVQRGIQYAAEDHVRYAIHPLTAHSPSPISKQNQVWVQANVGSHHLSLRITAGKNHQNQKTCPHTLPVHTCMRLTSKLNSTMHNLPHIQYVWCACYSGHPQWYKSVTISKPIFLIVLALSNGS
jgi:hypothetical protein